MAEFARFVRVPTDLLEMLLHERFTGGQLRVILWVIRNTCGWNRTHTPFTWYRIASELHMNRSAVYRAGRSLVDARVLIRCGAQLGIGLSFDAPTSPSRGAAVRQQEPCPASNDSVAHLQRERCQRAADFPRPKDSKDRLKTPKDKREENTSLNRSAMNASRKYERISEN